MSDRQGADSPSFTERKASQLRQERDANPPEERYRPDPTPTGAPGEALESADEGYPEDALTDEPEQDEEYDESPETLEGAPEGDEADEPEGRNIDWEARYLEAEKKISEVSANRTAMEQEHADMMSAQMTLRHGLEDSFTEAKRYAETYKSGFDQQIQQLENAFNSGMIEPDNLPAARQQYQNLVFQRNGMQQQIEQIAEREKEAKQLERERRAEIARMRLTRTIPNWGKEKHRELGEYAMQRGYTAEEFNETLDYRFLELLNDSMQLHQAGDTIKQRRRQRKAAVPKRDGKPLLRSADGRFKKAQQDFRANPNQRGRFADMKLAQLQKERSR